MAGGTPTLTLNDGGTATYASGSGTNALVFNTTVAAGQNAASLAATALNLPTGVTIADGAGNAASLSLSGLTQSGPQIDTTTPAVTAIADSPATGALDAGKTVALTLSFSEAVTVAGGTPTLTLNDGGTATYASGSGTNALDLQHYRGGRPERRLPRRDRAQPADRRHHRRQRRQRRQPVALRPRPRAGRRSTPRPPPSPPSPTRLRPALSTPARPSP